MLAWARRAVAQDRALATRVHFIEGCLPQASLPEHDYAAIISNSLLHHLHEPMVLWQTVRRYGRPATMVCVMDLRRPSTAAEAQRLAETYAGNEPEVLRRDFRNSLLAAFTPEEVRQQLERAGLEHLEVSSPGDRHVQICGRLGELKEAES